MNYRRSRGHVSGNVGEGLRDPPAPARHTLAARCEQSPGSCDVRRSPVRLGRAGCPACGGRPMAAGKARARDPEGTRAVILEVATRIFASRGFVGASMRDISDASGINKPLIYHHFGSKEGLYAAVKQNLAAACDRRSGIDRADERPAHPRAELWRLFKTLRDNEALLRICAWSRLERGGTSACELADLGLIKALRRRLELAQEQRIIRSDIDPGNLTVMLVGLVAFWLEGRSTADRVVEGGPDVAAYLRQAMALVERGLSLNREFA
jgi:TetR/AcrR family transcriptional regulator